MNFQITPQEIVFKNKDLLYHICSFSREDYYKRMCKNIYTEWKTIPFGYDIGISDKQLKIYNKIAKNISEIDPCYTPTKMIGKIKTRDPMKNTYNTKSLYPNGMVWCFDGKRLMTLKHREDGNVSWRYP